MQTIFDAGVEAGSAKPKRNDATQTIFVTLAMLEHWNEIASYCQQNPKRRFLCEREPGFLEDMIEQTADGDVPSEAQQVWLLKIYRRLEGESCDNRE